MTLDFAILVANGDLPGHDFHGNQWTTGPELSASEIRAGDHVRLDAPGISYGGSAVKVLKVGLKNLTYESRYQLGAAGSGKVLTDESKAPIAHVTHIFRSNLIHPVKHNLSNSSMKAPPSLESALLGNTELTDSGTVGASRLSETNFTTPVKGEKLTGRSIHLGALAHAQFKKGKNPAGWVEDEDVWDKAKEAASKTYSLDDEAYWPVVATIYEKMGGSVKEPDGKANAALDSALVNGDLPGHEFHGNQYAEAAHAASQASARAKVSDKVARQDGQQEDHIVAEGHHRDAAIAHLTAAKHSDGLDRDYHTERAILHIKSADIHRDRAAKLSMVLKDYLPGRHPNSAPSIEAAMMPNFDPGQSRAERGNWTPDGGPDPDARGANKSSMAAHRASAQAHRSGKPEDHSAAAAAHDEAAKQHQDTFHRGGGGPDLSKHSNLASMHKGLADFHRRAGTPAVHNSAPFPRPVRISNAPEPEPEQCNCSAEAHGASSEAHDASAQAFETGKPKDHDAAALAHLKAARAHKDASEAPGTKPDVAVHHAALASHHQQQAFLHTADPTEEPLAKGEAVKP